MQPIKKLDIQLANQIAAGEVVERPSSVVKELLENSLDAKARVIDIEITSGGTGLIRIRDNGSGIPKDQLALAIAPHATSKIGCFDDLTVIRSFGFRGEALSSISSVSRFTLSSRVKNAEQGWQAETEGSDQVVKLTPVAAAEGTRIDVRELFFNTPARRRFLRTDKTEFNHIEEVVKKVALANFKVAISLKHNSRVIRRFRAADDLMQQEQRVAAVCGRKFIQHSIRLDLEHQDIQIKGWLALPDYHRSQNDGQYFYVNNRPVKDKVLNHAIRQAYQNFIPEGRVPAYVLYLIIDPSKVDVNVHPTKHEVRFHDARLIHDLLVSAVEQSLSEGMELTAKDYQALSYPENEQSSNEGGYSNSGSYYEGSSGQASASDTKQHQAYRSLLESANSLHAKGVTEHETLNQKSSWRFLTRLNRNIALVENDQDIQLIFLDKLLELYIIQSKIKTENTDENSIQKLLFPVIVKTDNAQKVKIYQDVLEPYSIKSIAGNQQLTVLEIPFWMPVDLVSDICNELIALYGNDVSTYLQSNKQTNLIIYLLDYIDNLSSIISRKLSKSELLTSLLAQIDEQDRNE